MPSGNVLVGDSLEGRVLYYTIDGSYEKNNDNDSPSSVSEHGWPRGGGGDLMGSSMRDTSDYSGFHQRSFFLIKQRRKLIRRRQREQQQQPPQGFAICNLWNSLLTTVASVLVKATKRMAQQQRQEHPLLLLSQSDHDMYYNHQRRRRG